MPKERAATAFLEYLNFSPEYTITRLPVSNQLITEVIKRLKRASKKLEI